MFSWITLPVLLTSIVLTPALAQTTPANDDVVVKGSRLPRVKLPTETRGATSAGVVHRVAFENSERIAKCAMHTSLPKLRAAIDGAPNSAKQRAAQAWLVRRTSTCNTDAAIMAREEWDEGNAFGAIKSDLADGNTGAQTLSNRSVGGTSVYDRGALLEQAMKTFAPKLALTAAETSDVAVQRRFDRREGVRNVDREPEDLKYFQVTVCMVRLQPDMAVSLYESKAGSRDQSRLQALMISRARACVGNAKRVYVDATQFRIYVIDALYSWVVAARDVATLIPEQAPNSLSTTG